MTLWWQSVKINKDFFIIPCTFLQIVNVNMIYITVTTIHTPVLLSPACTIASLNALRRLNATSSSCCLFLSRAVTMASKSMTKKNKTISDRYWYNATMTTILWTITIQQINVMITSMAWHGVACHEENHYNIRQTWHDTRQHSKWHAWRILCFLLKSQPSPNTNLEGPDTSNVDPGNAIGV